MSLAPLRAPAFHLARRCFVFLSLLLAFGPTGCATSHSSRRVGDLEVLTFRREYTNAHVVRAPSGAAFMIDAGLAENAEALEADLRDAGVEPRALRAIVLTHGHADHAGGALHFQRLHGTRVVAGAEDRALLASGHNDSLCPTSDSAKGSLAKDQAAAYSPTAADVWVDAPTDLRPLLGFDASVRPLPGHTKGSLIVTVGDAVFVGDLFRGAVLGSSAELHYYQCDVSQNRADIRALLEAMPARTTFFVGHFGPVAGDEVISRFLTP